jgi:hypothetical protein
MLGNGKTARRESTVQILVDCMKTNSGATATQFLISYSGDLAIIIPRTAVDFLDIS